MKRIIGILALVACVAAFTTSCNKKCNCKTYALGVVVSEDEVELDKDTYKKCSDLNTFATDDNGQNKTGLECK